MKCLTRRVCISSTVHEKALNTYSNTQGPVGVRVLPVPGRHVHVQLVLCPHRHGHCWPRLQVHWVPRVSHQFSVKMFIENRGWVPNFPLTVGELEKMIIEYRGWVANFPLKIGENVHRVPRVSHQFSIKNGRKCFGSTAGESLVFRKKLKKCSLSTAGESSIFH